VIDIKNISEGLVKTSEVAPVLAGPPRSETMDSFFASVELQATDSQIASLDSHSPGWRGSKSFCSLDSWAQNAGILVAMILGAGLNLAREIPWHD
jgi:hypothetical protein